MFPLSISPGTYGTISGTIVNGGSAISATIGTSITGSIDGVMGVVGPSGQTLTATVRNETGATLTKGTVVYISGAAGNKALVSKASASSEAGSSRTFAILAQDIPHNQNGICVTVGLLTGLNTLGLIEGGNLWLSTIPGQWTQTIPVSPNHAVFLGNVTRVHQNQGSIEVRIQNGVELGEIHDVLLTAPTNGQVLKYDAASGLWVNASDLNSGVWGQIGGDINNQTDLQVELSNKYDVSNPAGYITTSALNGYATQYWVTSQGYLTASALTGYATESWVASRGYITASALTPYLTIASASSTYYPLTNPSGYITSAALSGYATQSWVTSQGYVTSSALTPYLTIASASATYQTLAGMSSYLTTSAAAAGYYPLTGNPSGFLTAASLSGYATESWVTAGFYPLASNPAGYITSAALSGYATESFVTSQGYITSAALSGYATESWVTSQGYLTSAPVTSVAGRTGAITLSTSDISGLGTMATASASDYSTTTVANGLYYPLSSNPAGYLTSAPVTSVAGRTGAVTLSNTDISGLGTLATVNDAPSDGNEYVRKNAAWSIASGGGSSYITSVSSPLAVTSSNLSIDLSAYAPLASPGLSGVPTAPTAAVGTNTTQIATTAFVIANAGGGGGGGGVDIQTFGSPTTSGTFTWTKPAGAKWVRVILYGAGSGGGSGARQPTTSSSGGGGGSSGGSFLLFENNADVFGATETVTIGAGGAGGASVLTDNTNGNPGTRSATSTSFGSFYRASNSPGGGGGTNTAGGGAGTQMASLLYFTQLGTGSGGAGGTGAAGSASGNSATAQNFIPLGGGGGSGRSTTLTSKAGGNAGFTTIAGPFTAGSIVSFAGGSGGNISGAPNGTNGTSRTLQYMGGGTGGGGGAYIVGSAGGNGGNGGWPGGGGGGGAASDNGFPSGKGGDGANGFACIITYF